MSLSLLHTRTRFAGLPIIQPYRQPKKHAIPTVVQVNTRFLKCVHLNIKLDNNHGYDCMQWICGRNVDNVLGCVTCRRWFWRQLMMIFPSIRRDRCSHAHPNSIYYHGEYMPPTLITVIGKQCTPLQCSAFPPNYVHSLDSTHMLMTALRCKGFCGLHR